MVQGQKTGVCPYLYSDDGGTGKGTFAILMKKMLGLGFTTVCQGSNFFSDYNGWCVNGSAIVPVNNTLP